MLSRLSSAQVSATHDFYGLQEGVGRAQQGIQASVSNQNTFPVPKLNNGSFRTFGDTLASALWPSPSQLSGSRAGQPSTSDTLTPNDLFPVEGKLWPEGAKALGAAGLDKSGTLHDGVEQGRLLTPGTNSRQTHGQTSTNSNEIGGLIKSGKQVDSKLASQPVPQSEPESSKHPPIRSAPPAAAAWAPARDVAANLIAAPVPDTGMPGGETAKTDSPDSQKAALVSTVTSTQRTFREGNSEFQTEIDKPEVDIEAFRLYLNSAVDEPGGVNANRTGQSIQGSPEAKPSGVFAEDLKVTQAGDSPETAPVGNAFRDEGSSVKRMAGSAEDGEGKSSVTKPETQASAGRQVTSRFEPDRQGNSSVANSSPDPGIVKGSSGPPQDILPAPSPLPRAVDPGSAPNSAPSGTARPVQLTESVEPARLNPANQMTVRVEGGSGQVISVRFLNQGGQVEVAVRSSDPAAASQLRQELTSLTGNLDRIGWRTDVAATIAHQTSPSHDASGSDRNSQGSDKGSNLDWEEGPPKKKSPAPEFWDELRDRQDT